MIIFLKLSRNEETKKIGNECKATEYECKTGICQPQKIERITKKFRRVSLSSCKPS